MIPILQGRAPLRSHHQVWPNAVGPHPEQEGPVAGDEAVLQHRKVRSRSLWDEGGVHWEWKRQVANFNRFRRRVAQSNGPTQNVAVRLQIQGYGERLSVIV